MNDLQVVVKQEIGNISFNYDEIKQLVLDETKKYSGLVLTEEDVAPAKKDRAELNHKFEDLETRRKEIEKTYNAPLNDFKVKIKEIGKFITDASDTIDKQIKVFEDAKKLEKKHDIEKVFAELVGNMADYLPLDKIYDTKWENVSVSMKSIRTAIEQLVSSTALAVETINKMNSEAKEKALEQYKLDLSLTNAITYINKYEAQKAEILAKEEAKRKVEEERKHLADIERVKAEEKKRAAEENPIRGAERDFHVNVKRLHLNSQPNSERVETPSSQTGGFINKREIKAIYTVTGTQDDFTQVEAIFNSLEIHYERNDA